MCIFHPCVQHNDKSMQHMECLFPVYTQVNSATAKEGATTVQEGSPECLFPDSATAKEGARTDLQDECLFPEIATAKEGARTDLQDECLFPDSATAKEGARTDLQDECLFPDSATAKEGARTDLQDECLFPDSATAKEGATTDQEGSPFILKLKSVLRDRVGVNECRVLYNGILSILSLCSLCYTCDRGSLHSARNIEYSASHLPPGSSTCHCQSQYPRLSSDIFSICIIVQVMCLPLLLVLLPTPHVPFLYSMFHFLNVFFLLV